MSSNKMIVIERAIYDDFNKAMQITVCYLQARQMSTKIIKHREIYLTENIYTIATVLCRNHIK